MSASVGIDRDHYLRYGATSSWCQSKGVGIAYEQTSPVDLETQDIQASGL